MRATISFEIDVDQVEGTMGLLVAQEADTLRAVADMIDINPGPRTMVLEEVTEALKVLRDTTVQLGQYRDMLLSFERARLETLAPQRVAAGEQPAVSADLHTQGAEKAQFDNFLNRIGEDDLDEDTEEG